MRIIGIIPVRMGSKSILKKNLQMIGNRTLVEMSAKAANVICDEWFVSSESFEIQEISHKNNYKYLNRPDEYAQDDSTDLDYLRHHVNYDLNLNDEDWLVLIRPTSPLRTIESLLNFQSVLRRDISSSSVRSVIESPITPYKMWRIKNGYLEQLDLPEVDGIEEPFNSPRQRLPKIYWQTGTYDAYRVLNIKNGYLSGENILSFFAGHPEIDIDTHDDLERAKQAYLMGNYGWV